MKLRSGAATAAAVATLVSALLAAAQPSRADSEIRTEGASASFQSWGEKFRIWDTGNDDSDVYLIYHRPGAGSPRIDYNGGYGTMGLFDQNFGELQDIYYKVCVDRRPFLRDRCSGWKKDKT
jgi:hypothetical protein